MADQTVAFDLNAKQQRVVVAVGREQRSRAAGLPLVSPFIHSFCRLRDQNVT